MQAIYDLHPLNPSDSDVTITASTSASGFPTTNLKYPQPVRSWKSTVVTESYVNYDFGVNVTYDSLFLNRFNFAAFTVKYSTAAAPTTWITVETVTGLTKDEIYDEYYMHRFVDLSGLTYRHLRIIIPTQTPLFEVTYFKIGNLYIGNKTQLWWPKPGFKVSHIPKINLREFYSGYVEQKKIGRTKRVFEYMIDKTAKSEYDNIRLTHENFVIHFDWMSDKTQVFLVRLSKETIATFNLVDNVNASFEMEEIV